MEILPSYAEATTNPDWLDLVALYVPVVDWYRCSLVDGRFYRQFAPRLWKDPLVTVRHLGLHPNDDLAWYRRFISRHVRNVRLEVRSYVHSLDFREFALRASGLYSSEASERAISESFRQLPEIFPRLVCLLVDGHPELDPGLLTATRSSSQSLQLLDLTRCRQELTPKLFNSGFFRNLVYLDVSFIPGSVRTAIQSSLNPQSLPELRILRVAGREVDNSTATLLFRTFRCQLWSLDLSYNKLGDEAIDDLVEHCFPASSFHTSAHFEKEGKLVSPKNIGSRNYGPFWFIEESETSSCFQHPERYLADSPMYSQRADRTDLQEWQVVRPDGLSPLKRDDANAVKELLLDEAIPATTGTSRALRGQARIGYGGLTHLHLNGNRFTVSGIERLLRTSRGRLEHFECDSCVCSQPNTKQGGALKQLNVVGLPGSAYLFRPVISSGIRSLRVHHSIITQIPSVSMEGLSLASAIRLAEGPLLGNVRRAYPRPLVPDTNPRITSLTLTNIPARSTGPIIEQLTRFLDLVSTQQKAINDVRALSRGRGPSVIRGLRHIRLELEPGFLDDTSGTATDEDVDFDRLLDPGDENFGNETSGFFDAHSLGITSRANEKPQAGSGIASNTINTGSSHGRWTSGRLKSYPYSDVDSPYVTQLVDAKDSWTGNVFSVPVWIGSGVLGPHAAVNEYMWNVQDPDLRSNIGPASPNHVAAGVPPGSHIYHAAWDAIVFPRNVQAAVAAAKSDSPFRDVAAAIKEYRLRTRGTAEHWDGKLELVRTDGAARYLRSEYWR
ncbi:hypothetical protein F4779DRAFT_584641 [Xylariaceae sp. FL0662B]|nr:hypothetical protein F4779DRAFT_584641 [Xylariaceae sp. FL0662B]